MSQKQNQNPTKSKNYFAFSQKSNELNLYLYEDIQPDSRNWWTDEVEVSETSAKSVNALIEGAGDVKQINLFINSNGGDVKEGIGIYSALNRHPAQKTAYIDGFAASIASVIAMSCDKIVMSPLSLMFVHHASMCIYGNAEQLRKAADDVETIDSCSTKAYRLHAGEKLSEERLRQLLDGETWLTAEQCLELGLCDEIESKTSETEKAVAQRMINAFRQRTVREAAAAQISVIEQLAEKFN